MSLKSTYCLALLFCDANTVFNLLESDGIMKEFRDFEINCNKAWLTVLLI